MAENSMDFGIGNIASALTRQDELRKKRQAEQQNFLADQVTANQQKEKIAKQSAGVSQQLAKDTTGLVDILGKVESAKQETDALRQSSNPLDLLDLVGKQVRDPGLYTRDGRTKTVAEANQTLNARTQIASIQQSALQDMNQLIDVGLAAKGAGLKAAELNEAQNAELIQAEITRVQTMGQTLAASNTLQEQKLAMMSEEETRRVYESSKGKPIDVGGVMLSPGLLESRMQTLEDRQVMRDSRESARDAKKVELERKLAKKELETMNLEELRPLMLSGDQRYALEDIKQVYDTKLAAQTKDIERQTQLFKYSDFGASTIVPAATDADRMSQAIPQNSPAGVALKAYQNSIGFVAGRLKQFQDAGIPIPIEIIASADVALKEEREKLDKAIDKEATLKAKGDKNLKDAYTNLYRGEPVDRASVTSAVQSRLEKGAPLDDILPAEVGKLVQTRYQEIFQDLQRKNSMNPLGSDKATIKQMAMQQAINEGIGTVITSRTQDMFTNQLKDPSNPLYGAMSPNTFLGMVAKADAEGTADFKRTYGLSDEEYTRFAKGEAIEGKVTSAQRAELGVIQSQRLLMQLDSVNPGLAKKYSDWWGSKGPAYAEQTQQARIANATRAGLPDAAMESYAGDMEKEGQYAYMQVMSAAQDSYDGAKEERFNSMISFDYKPTHRQAALLQMDESLNDGERQNFMKGFIFPLMQQAKESNLDYEATNALIEKAIDANIAEDPQIAKLLNKVAKNRSRITENVESIMSKPFWRAQNPNLRRALSVRKYAWYEEIAGEQ